jgi:hypothetical protein
MLRYLDENSEEHGRALLYALNLQSAIPRDLIPDFSSETDMRNARSTEEKNAAVLAERERGMGTASVPQVRDQSCDIFTNGRRSLAERTSLRCAS